MMSLSPVVIRNVLRYLAGALVAQGIIGADVAASLVADPVLVQASTVAGGIVIGAVAEVTYAFARRLGWRT